MDHLSHMIICTIFLFKNLLKVVVIIIQETEAMAFIFKEIKHLADKFQCLVSVNFVLICQFLILQSFL